MKPFNRDPIKKKKNKIKHSKHDYVSVTFRMFRSEMAIENYLNTF